MSLANVWERIIELVGLPSNQATIGITILVELVKWGVGLIGLLLITRWTLARADKKDALARRAALEIKRGDDRIDALRRANVAIARIRLELITIESAARAWHALPEVDRFDLHQETDQNAQRIIEAQDPLLLAAEDYGLIPDGFRYTVANLTEAFIIGLGRVLEPIETIPTSHEVEMCYHELGNWQRQLEQLVIYEKQVQDSASLSRKHVLKNDPLSAEMRVVALLNPMLVRTEDQPFPSRTSPWARRFTI